MNALASMVRAALRLLPSKILLFSFFLIGLCLLPQTGYPYASGKVLTATEPSATSSVEGLSIEQQGVMSGVLGRDNAIYHASIKKEEIHFNNSLHALEAAFDKNGVNFRVGDLNFKLTAEAIGYGNSLKPLKRSEPTAHLNQVEYDRGILTEWYINGPLGLEQGFTVHKKPSGKSEAPLTIALNLSGNLSPSNINDKVVLFKNSKGDTQLHYQGLVAKDANGKELSSRLEVRDSSILLHVDDANARYPIIVDPFFQQAKLMESTPGLVFGFNVAIEGDTIAVISLIDYNLRGAVYVFLKSTMGWENAQEVAKLTASDAADGDFLGFGGIAIQGDTILVGAEGNNNQRGAAYVFVKPANGWVDATETAKLIASDGVPGDALGSGVSTLSIYEDTIVVGARVADTDGLVNNGAVYVFVKPPGGWVNATETAKLTASDAATNDLFGHTVGVYEDTIVIGAPLDSTGAIIRHGSVYVFVKPDNGWLSTNQETAKLIASDQAPGDIGFTVGSLLGMSVGIFEDTIVAGARFNDVGSNIDQGSAYVFVKPEGGWVNATETAKLTASDGAAGDLFGTSVAIDGDTIVVGATEVSTNGIISHGAAYVFTKPTTGWVNMTESAKLVHADITTDDDLGAAVGIFHNTIVAGAPNKTETNPFQGAVYVFELSPFKGFFPPVNNFPTLNEVKAGQAIPMKFSIKGDHGLNIFAEGYPKSEQIDCNSISSINNIEDLHIDNNSGLSYDAASDQYKYLWKTEKSWEGTCRQFIIKFSADGSVERANFKFKK